MRLAEPWRRLAAEVHGSLSGWPALALLQIGGLLVLVGGILLATPIVAIDHDLFYHLSHGRHLFSQGEIPSTSYFSFLEPQRHWVDYYWLFQALVFAVFQVTGYWGLIALRAALGIACLATVAAFLLRRAHTRTQRLVAAGVWSLYAGHALDRALTVRPHLVSYLMIPLLLLLIESKHGPRWPIPLLAVLWVNFHGVEYPVLVLLALAYLSEIFARRWLTGWWTGRPPTGEERRLALALAAAMAAIFATPHGAALLRVPFRSLEYASHYLGELSRLPVSEYFRYYLSLDGWSQRTAVNVLFVLAALALCRAVLTRSLRWSHLILFVGGSVLLFKAARFSYEFAMLSLPLLEAQILALTSPAASASPETPDVETPSRAPAGRSPGIRGIADPFATVVILVVFAVPWLGLLGELPARPGHYPLALADTPHGIARYLQTVDAGGEVLNNPNVGGYLQWTLPPGYRIAMDLEIPFLFADEDMFRVASAFFDPVALRRFVELYRPSWIAATLASERFPALIEAHPAYRLVFFDDETALYVDSRRHPEIAARDELRAVEPFQLNELRPASLEPARRQALRRDLERVDAIDPDISSVLQSLAVLAVADGRHDDALRLVERALRQTPELARLFAIRGDALRSQGQFAAAVVAYDRALELTEHAPERQAIQRSRSVALARLGRFDDAFNALRKAVGVFDIEAPVADLYALAELAAAAGRVDTARKMLDFASWKVAPDDAVWRQRIDDLGSRLGAP